MKLITYIVNTIVGFTILNAIIFIIIGVEYTGKGIYHFFFHRSSEHFPAIEILESLDMFLAALVFLIFAAGIYNIFMLRDQSKENDPVLHPGHIFNISSFSDLKTLLWKTILTTLLVHFMSIVIQSSFDLQWNHLIIPVSILILSISSKFFSEGHH